MNKKILYFGLATHYTEDMTYQEQELVKQNISDGCDVIYVTDCMKYEKGVLKVTTPETTKIHNNATLIRPKCMYTGTASALINYIHRFFRIPWTYLSIRKIVHNFSPDIIFSHGPLLAEVLYYVHLKKHHPNINIYFNYHVDSLNSGKTTGLLKIIYSLKDLIYSISLKRAFPHVNKIFYIWGGTKDYITKWHKIPEDMLEFYPLGGRVPDKVTYSDTRKRVRESFNLQPDDILFIHTGKLSPEKRTDEIVTAFKAISNEKFKLVILGSIPDNQKELLLPLINSDTRIKYLGWKTGSELQEYLCASDVYIQLGSASATMQNALCCGCPVLLNSCNGYYKEFMRGNGMFVNDGDELVNALHLISTNPGVLEDMKDATWKIALELLDYRKLAARIYE